MSVEELMCEKFGVKMPSAPKGTFPKYNPERLEAFRNKTSGMRKHAEDFINNIHQPMFHEIMKEKIHEQS